MKYFTAILALGLAAPITVLANSSWSFITDAEDGGLYFGRNVRQHGDLTFVDVKTEEDPDGSNGDDNKWVIAFNCKEKTFKDSDKMIPVEEGFVYEDIFKFACK